MLRDPAALADREFDLVIAGAGSHGTFAAWDAAMRGLRVALVDRGDLVSGASSNSLKVAHGGLRYLQKLDFRRMRASAAERSTLLRLAPHLVRPLGFAVPTQGLGVDSKAALRAGLALNDLVTWDRNAGLSGGSRIPGGRLLSRPRARELFPDFERALDGAALWYDCQIVHPERLYVAIAEAAADAGATVANYVALRGPVLRNGTVFAAAAEDTLTGVRFEIRTRAVLNTAGSWWTELLPHTARSPRLARGINLVVRRAPGEHALGFRALTPASGDPVTGGHRYIFMCPWRGRTMLGTSYAVDSGDRAPPRLAEFEALLAEFNAAYPALGLQLDDVTFFHWGLVPLKDDRERGRATAPSERAWIFDHAADGMSGMFSAIGPKLTTARRVAEDAVNRVVEHLGMRPPRCRTTVETLAPASQDAGDGRLWELYGPRAERVTELARNSADWAQPLASGCPMLAAEVIHAVRYEAAVRLPDVVFRRSDLGTAGRPPAAALDAAARLMAAELGWSAARKQEELDLVRSAYAPLPEPSMPQRVLTG